MSAPRQKHLRRVVIALVVLTLALSAGVRLVDLGHSRHHVFDEYYYAGDAARLLSHGFGQDGRWVWMPGAAQGYAHPELGVLAIAAGIKTLGDGPWGWRLPSALAGIALLALVFPLARRLGLPPRWALAATVLAASDSLLVIQSRLAMLDIFVALGTAACIYAALRAAASTRRRFALWVVACGVLGGLALACKWSGGLAIAASFVVLAIDGRKQGARRLVAAGAAIVGLAAVVYVISYLPYFLGGHSVGQWLHLQRFMVDYNLKARAHIPKDASRPATWPFDLVPFWYQWSGGRHGTPAGYLAIGNPLLWWASIVAFVGLGARALTRRDLRLALTPLIVAVLYAPWLATSRPAFIYYMTPVVPFLAILVATGLSKIASREPSCRRSAALSFPGALLLAAGALGMGGLGQTTAHGSGAAYRGAAALAGVALLTLGLLGAARGERRGPELRDALCWAYVGATVAVGIMFLPFVIGYPVSAGYYDLVMWLPSWW